MNTFNISDPSFIKSVDDSSVPRDGLVLHLDAFDWNSYPKTGGTWYDISGKGNHFAIATNAFNSNGAMSAGPKVNYMDFAGSYGCAKHQTSDFVPGGGGNVTAIVWTNVLNSTGTWRTLFRGNSSSGNHQVIVQSGGNTLGMYDNDGGNAFVSSGADITTIPGFGTTQFCMCVWRYSPSNPYYLFTYNDTPQTTRGQVNATPQADWGGTRGICSIGAYNNAEQNTVTNCSQFWGWVSIVMIYNRVLSNSELLALYQARKNRFGF